MSRTLAEIGSWLEHDANFSELERFSEQNKISAGDLTHLRLIALNLIAIKGWRLEGKVNLAQIHEGYNEIWIAKLQPENRW